MERVGYVFAEIVLLVGSGILLSYAFGLQGGIGLPLLALYLKLSPTYAKGK